LLGKVKNLTDRQFVRNVASVAGGTAASQAIVMASRARM
jgi:hypothetical protein